MYCDEVPGCWLKRVQIIKVTSDVHILRVDMCPGGALRFSVQLRSGAQISSSVISDLSGPIVSTRHADIRIQIQTAVIRGAHQAEQQLIMVCSSTLNSSQ